MSQKLWNILRVFSAACVVACILLAFAPFRMNLKIDHLNYLLAEEKSNNAQATTTDYEKLVGMQLGMMKSQLRQQQAYSIIALIGSLSGYYLISKSRNGVKKGK